MRAYIFRFIGIGAGFITVLWTGLLCLDVIGPVVAADGIVPVPSPVATFRVVDGNLELVKGNGGVTKYNAGVISSIFVPFALLSLFAMYGAWSVGKPVRASVRHTDRPTD